MLAESDAAWRNFGKYDMRKWEHLQSETAGRTGFAMQLEPAGIIYKKPEDAPGLNYRIKIQNQGIYHVWLLMYVADAQSDLRFTCFSGGWCHSAIAGTVLKRRAVYLWNIPYLLLESDFRYTIDSTGTRFQYSSDEERF